MGVRERASKQARKQAVYVLLGVGLGPIVEGMARVLSSVWGTDGGWMEIGIDLWLSFRRGICMEIYSM